jgi:transcription initiation factor TFIIIB Brf1 subunit/transcription initiation factor TFIIB
MNRWNIPEELEKEIIERDKVCVYCGCEFSDKSKKTTATWEHITNDMRIITRENISRCCSSCNASKGSKLLSDWLDSKYCKTKGITSSSVAQVVKDALINSPSIDFEEQHFQDSLKLIKHLNKYQHTYYDHIEFKKELSGLIESLDRLIEDRVNKK